MKRHSTETLVLGGGIGGMSAAYELLKRGASVSLLERGNQLGGLMQGVYYEDFSVDLGQKQFYYRIPEVHAWLQEVTDHQYREFPCRIGALYKGKLYERERGAKGAFRGMGAGMLTRGIADLAWQKIRYCLKPVQSLQDQAYSHKGKLFSKMFSQGFDEKLKCRPWSSVPPEITLGASATQNPEGPKGKLNKGQSGQLKWYHPVKGSGGLVEALRNKIQEMGGKIYFGVEVRNIHHDAAGIRSIELKQGRDTLKLECAAMFSSLRLEQMASLLGIETTKSEQSLSFRRGVLVVYLYFDSPPAFPHTCIWVNSPNKKVGRITNYAAYQCGMVPEGKSCFAFELFALCDSSLFQKSTDEVVEMVKGEMRASKLFDFSALIHSKVLKYPLGDPGSNWGDYRDDPSRQQLYNRIARIKNLYNVSRTGLDKTIHASILAVKSLYKGEKKGYLRATSPEVHEPWRG